MRRQRSGRVRRAGGRGPDACRQRSDEREAGLPRRRWRIGWAAFWVSTALTVGAAEARPDVPGGAAGQLARHGFEPASESLSGAAGHHAAAVGTVVERWSTVAGELTVVEHEGAPEPVYSVRLGGELVRRFDARDETDALAAFPEPRVLRRFDPGVPPFDEVLLFQQHSSGNACDGGPLWLLGLRRDGSREVSSVIDFCGGRSPEVSTDGERVRIHAPGGAPNRGEGCIPPETWVYERGEVRRVAGGGSPHGPGAAEPWAYCRASGAVDEPAAGRLGPEAAAALHARVRETFDLPDEMPEEAVAAQTVWRCMDGEVWACIVGANLPCGERADTSRAPAEGLRSYCRDHPDSDVVPAFVTGRATVYSWRCTGGEPEVAGQWSEPDPRGFHAEIWRQLCPPDATSLEPELP